MVTGGIGNDTIVSSTGADTITGGVGVDAMTGSTGGDRFVFAAGDSSSTAGSNDSISDFSFADGDKMALGVVSTLANTLVGTAATDYAQALSDATALIGSGSRDIVAIQVGADTYVFSDSSSTNAITNAIKLTGATASTLSVATFV